jgi:hypothetical protein
MGRYQTNRNTTHSALRNEQGYAGVWQLCTSREKLALFIHVSCCSLWTRRHFSFLILQRVSRTPWKGDQPYRTQDNTNTEETQTDIHALSGIRTRDYSVWAGEESSCLVNTPFLRPSFEFPTSLIQCSKIRGKTLTELMIPPSAHSDFYAHLNVSTASLKCSASATSRAQMSTQKPGILIAFEWFSSSLQVWLYDNNFTYK